MEGVKLIPIHADRRCRSKGWDGGFIQNGMSMKSRQMVLLNRAPMCRDGHLWMGIGNGWLWG
jgi:hypothetical protein